MQFDYIVMTVFKIDEGVFCIDQPPLLPHFSALMYETKVQRLQTPLHSDLKLNYNYQTDKGA